MPVDYPKPPYPSQKQPMPGTTAKMEPRPDHGETSYKGSGRLEGIRAVITGGDSGIGRAVAIAYAREGADVLIAYLNEAEDAKEVKALSRRRAARRSWSRATSAIPSALPRRHRARRQGARRARYPGQQCRPPGDVQGYRRHQRRGMGADLPGQHPRHVLSRQGGGPHMRPGSAIINTASVNSDMPNPILLAYATTKGAIQNFTGGLAQMLAPKGIRANAVAPGPIWTPLIPSTMPEEAVKNFGKQVPMQRAGQPAELATAYVMLADPLSSFTSGTTVAVTGGKPFI